MTALESIAGTAVEIVIFGLAGGILYRVWHRAAFLPQRRVLLPFSRGVVLHGERVEKILESGAHWIMPRQTLVPVDIRPKPFKVSPIDLLAGDHSAVRIAFSGEYQVVDPALYVRESTDSFGSLFIAMERAIPLAVAEFDREAVLANPSHLADRVKERIEPRAAQLGFQITTLEVSSVIPIH